MTTENLLKNKSLELANPTFLADKNILIISPQPWGKMKFSKHYYALVLAKNGNKVFFLQYQKNAQGNKLTFENCSDHPNITIIKYSHLGPYRLKFHGRPLFHYLMRTQARRIRKSIGMPIDIVWDFDCNFIFGRLKDFGASFNIFHPVDQGTMAPSYKKPDLILSVSPVLLNAYNRFNVPGFFINHGLSEVFEKLARKNLQNIEDFDYSQKDGLSIGYIGNLKHRSIDRSVLKQIISSNQKHKFHFFGPYEITEGEQDEDLSNFIAFLKKQKNCIFYGICDQDFIAKKSIELDIFLACYKKTTNYHADNSHKILEYLSTGKAVVSNHLSVYQDKNLVQMPKNFSNDELPEIFHRTLQNIEEHNSFLNRQMRLKYALNNTYGQQVKRIDQIILQRISEKRHGIK